MKGVAIEVHGLTLAGIHRKVIENFWSLFLVGMGLEKSITERFASK